MHAVWLLPIFASLPLLQAGAVPPAAQPVASRPAAAEPEFRTAEDLLAALETADRDLHTLSAEIRYTREFGSIEGNTQQEWTGVLHYNANLTGDGPTQGPGDGGQARPARRGFAVLFDESILDNRRRKERRDFVFDGEWLVERLHGERQMIRRRVVPPGQVADPLRIGEGPFPIPIGQKREDILARYTAELLPAAGGLDRSKPKEASIMKFTVGMDQLRLVPRPERADEDDFEEIRLWYKRSEDGRLLPQLARTISDSGDESLVILRDVRVNEPLPEGAMDTAQPPAGWDVRIVPWERAAGG